MVVDGDAVGSEPLLLRGKNLPLGPRSAGEAGGDRVDADDFGAGEVPVDVAGEADGDCWVARRSSVDSVMSSLM